MSSIRDLARRLAPRKGRDLARALKAKVIGPGIEEVVLGAWRFEPEDHSGRRLTLLIPSVASVEAFGGVNTCIEFLIRLVQRLDLDGEPVELRILAADATPPEQTVLPAMCARLGLPLERISFGALARGGVIPTRRRDLFIPYNWWTGLNIHDALIAQHAHYGGERTPKYQFMQDYEPAFYAFSSAHLLALQAFNLDWPTHVVFNSSELKACYDLQGARADKSFVFEPKLNPALSSAAQNLDKARKEKLILVYARPGVARNCWSILRRGLEIWAQEGRFAADFEVISAGETHAPVALGGGKTLRPLGKLSLEEYGNLLRRVGLGVSLMASPHPSYPPLEMAHFGARVLTNAYPGKDLSQRHENITSLRDVRPEALALALDALCADFGRDPEAGLRARSFMPSYMSDSPFDCLEALADDMRSVWSR